jgi:hypothetical protein
MATQEEVQKELEDTKKSLKATEEELEKQKDKEAKKATEEEEKEKEGRKSSTDEKEEEKKAQDELQKYQIVAQRINLLNQVEPKDQFGEKYSQADLDKHYAKAEFEKLTPSTVKKV